MPGLLLNAANMTTEKLLPMVEATTTAIPISKTTTTIITNLSAGSHGQNKRPTIIIYPTVSPESIVIPIVSSSRTTRAISLRSERSMSRGFPSLELDTVMEERSDDPEQTQIDLMTPESPSDPMKPSDSSSS